jgi:hypothetical protein
MGIETFRVSVKGPMVLPAETRRRWLTKLLRKSPGSLETTAAAVVIISVLRANIEPLQSDVGCGSDSQLCV